MAIEHVVVLMLENHSFDQMLGSLSAVYPDLDGVDPTKPRSNPDYPDDKRMIYQSETKLTSISLDPAHEFVNVNHQLANGGAFTRPASERDLDRATEILRHMAMPGLVSMFDESLVAAEFFLRPAFPSIGFAYTPQNVTNPLSVSSHERRNDLVDFQSRDVRCVRKGRVPHHVQVRESRDPERL